ncbi:MAG: hypothetical protein IPI67_21060 [Myxococcales bacterium]|nr:hypothetical protein [Myxococcales bacterium]
MVEDEVAHWTWSDTRSSSASYSALDAPVIHVAGNHDLICMTEDDLARMWNHDGALHYSRGFSGCTSRC